MVAFYQHDIAAWMDGTESLSDGEYRVYHVLCELMYLNNGPIVLHESGLAGRCKQHVLTFRSNLAKLIGKGKLINSDDGKKLSNNRVEHEIARIRKKPKSTPNLRSTSDEPGGGRPEVEQRSLGGRQNNPLKNKESAGDTFRQEKRREENKEDSESPSLLRESSNRETSLSKQRAHEETGSLFPKTWEKLAGRSLDYALIEKKLNRHDADEEFDSFRNHHIALGSSRMDWFAAWRSWVCREVKNRRNRNGGGNGRVNGRSGSSLVEAADEILRGIEQGDGGEISEADRRQLSAGSIR